MTDEYNIIGQDYAEALGDGFMNWEKVLDGREPLNKDNVRAIFDRLLEKIK